MNLQRACICNIHDSLLLFFRPTLYIHFPRHHAFYISHSPYIPLRTRPENVTFLQIRILQSRAHPALLPNSLMEFPRWYKRTFPRGQYRSKFLIYTIVLLICEKYVKLSTLCVLLLRINVHSLEHLYTNFMVQPAWNHKPKSQFICSKTVTSCE